METSVRICFVGDGEMDIKGNRYCGTIKWTAMMLPEHVQLLRELQAEDNIVPEPKHDEYDSENSYMVEGTIKQLPMNTAYVTVLSPQGNKQILYSHTS